MRGGRGYGGARGCACAPRPESRLAREESVHAVAPELLRLSRLCGFEPRAESSVPTGRGIRSRPRVSLRGARVVRPGARSRGRAAGGVSAAGGSDGGERAAAVSLARLHAPPQFPLSRRPASHLSLPAPGAAWGFPEPGPRALRPSPGLLGLTNKASPALARETLGSELQPEQVADGRSAGGGLWTHLCGMEMRALLLLPCKGS